MRKLLAFTCIIFASAAISAHAAVFFTDGFDYLDGQLTDSDSTTGAGGTGANVSGDNWTAHSGATSDEYIQVIDGQAELLISNTEDVNRIAGDTQTGGETWYYGARVTVNDLREPEDVGAIGSNYFMHFKDDGTFNFRGRAYITPPSDPESSDFRFGLSASSVSSSSGGQIVNWGSDLAFGQEYTIVVSYVSDDGDAQTAGDGFSSLWVNPVDSSSTSILDDMPNPNINTGVMSSLAMRGPNAGANQPQVLVDVASIGDSFDEVLAALGSAPTNDADFDDSNSVDGIDLGIWESNYGSAATATTGDANGDGVADGEDFLQWQREFTGVPALSAIGVPKPTSIALIGLALAFLPLVRRK